MDPSSSYYERDFSPLQRLGSPIHLADSRLPSTTCAQTTRRRSRGSTQSPRRRRSSQRVATAPHAFDQLSWISSMDSYPEFTNPWDIADLSLIPDEESPSSGLGPVRRRKTSLRSSPLDFPAPCPLSSPLPLRDTSLLPPHSVSTPRSRFVPSRVLFQNLMPVSCDDNFP